MDKFVFLVLFCLLIPVNAVAATSTPLPKIIKKVPVVINDPDKAVKENMRRVQHEAEQYSMIDMEGYPESIQTMLKVSVNSGFWEEIKNPYTGKMGVGKTGAVIDFKRFKTYKQDASLKGLIVYEPYQCKNFVQLKIKKCARYKIYGLDKTGKLLKKNGKVFFMSN